MADTKKSKTVAFASHPLIEAVVKQLYRFSDIAQARRRLEQIQQKFEISSQQEAADAISVKMWIKGFSVGEEEQKLGYLGNYAQIGTKKVAEGHVILLAEKLEIPLQQHPQRARPRYKHPNWGHPILRGIKKKKMFSTLQDAQVELELLHREFPDTSVPNVNKLHILVYTKTPENAGNPTKKVTFEIKPGPDHSYFIHAQEGKMRPKTQKPRRNIVVSPAITGSALPDGVQAIQGRFTALVEMKKRRPR